MTRLISLSYHFGCFVGINLHHRVKVLKDILKDKKPITAMAVLGLIGFCTAMLLLPVRAQEARQPDAPLITGLDHIPLAVRDLEQAAERFRELGFALKPGRPHANGIRNRHIKFPDGTEIELITAPEARDGLTAGYLRHLSAGDGPAFVAFYAPDISELARQFDHSGQAYQRSGGILTLPESDSLRYIFFGLRNSSPTDRPEHFAHPNGAAALIAVWLAGEDLSAARDLLSQLGAKIAKKAVYIPEPITVPVATLPQAEVLFLPEEYQHVAERRIIGATLRVRDLDTVLRILAAEGGEAPPVVNAPQQRSIFLPPEITHGIWLEFRERR